uniref:NUDIX hydrolase n=2 Tax=Candidatus Giovannoniibacteriota TaxID=1752738 RepID=A0A0G0ZJF7_9BACT|nr:MAG: NUDIX hydrolase [Candidatus Giovannonibacteria bacterium GW2011_GWF2_42_19]
MSGEIKQRIAGKAVIVQDGKVLILRESDKYKEGTNKGRYDFPGGRVKSGENHEEALKREVREECSLEIEIERPIFVGEWQPMINPVRSSREALKPVLAKTKPHSIPRQAAGRSASNGVNGEKIHIFGIFYRCSTLNFEGITLGGDHDEYKWINFDERDNFDLIFPNCEVIAELEKDWLSRLPAKRMGAGVLFFNEKGELLIVKPHYKDYWSIPGGVVDKNESPRAAAIRETKEEIGIEVNKADFLCVDYISGNDGKGENLQFIFYGGVLNDEQAKQIKADGKEIMEYKFVPKEEALKLLGEGKKLSCSIEQFLEQKEFKPLYLEDGCAFTD